MIESYKLYYKESYLGDIIYDSSKDKFSFVKSNATKDFPPIMSKSIFTGEPKERIGDKEIREFIEDRVVPENRQAIECNLYSLDLTAWIPWMLFKRTSGMTQIDFYWINSYGAESFNDHIRNGKMLPYHIQNPTCKRTI